MRRAAFVPCSPQVRSRALRPHTHLAEPRGICRPAENISKPSVVRRIPTVKGQTSVWRECCACGRTVRSSSGAAPDVRPGSGQHAARARGTAAEVSCVLLVCGRAPGRALWSGRYGSASIGAAWVGPLHWTQRAGGDRRPNPRGRRTGPGGGEHLPDCVLYGSRWGAGQVGRRTGGMRRPMWSRTVREAPGGETRGCIAIRDWPNNAGRPTRWGTVRLWPDSNGAAKRPGYNPHPGPGATTPGSTGSVVTGSAGPLPGAHAHPVCAARTPSRAPLSWQHVPQRRSRVLVRRFVHSLWRRRCVGWWGGAVSPRASAP